WCQRRDAVRFRSQWIRFERTHSPSYAFAGFTRLNAYRAYINAQVSSIVIAPRLWPRRRSVPYTEALEKVRRSERTLTFRPVGSSLETGSRRHSYQGKIPQMRDSGL